MVGTRWTSAPASLSSAVILSRANGQCGGCSAVRLGATPRRHRRRGCASLRRDLRREIGPLSAPLRRPSAGASAGRSLASPHTTATVPGQAAGAGGPLVACRYADPDGSIVSDMSLQIGRPATAKDVAIADLHAVAICAVARSALGDDENAPTAVVARACKGCARRSGNAGRRQGTGQKDTAESVANHGYSSLKLDTFTRSGVLTNGAVRTRPEFNWQHHVQLHRV